MEPIIAALTLLILDGIWLGIVGTQFYIDTIGKLLRMSDKGAIQPLWFAAVVVYVALISGIVLFVLPKANGQLLPALFWGGLFGFVTYATYDFTNLAVLNHWSLKISVIDTLWGMVLCGTTSLVTVLLTHYLFRV